MPLYDFRGPLCGHEFTVLVAAAEKDRTVCPACGSGQVQQLFRGFGISSPGSSCTSSGTRFG